MQSLDKYIKERLTIDKLYLPTIAMNYKLNGGIPKGRVVEIFGKEASGKTFLTLAIAIENLKRDKEIEVYYMDTENAFTIDFIQEKLKKEEMKRFKISNENRAEKLFIEIEKIFDKAKKPIVIIDSIASLVASEEVEEDYDKSMQLNFQKMLGKFFKRNIKDRISKGWLLCINQTRVKIGGYIPDEYHTIGGRALKFYASLRLQLKKVKLNEEGKFGIEIKVAKSKISDDNIKMRLLVKNNFDIEKYFDLKDILIEKNIIEEVKKGWYKLKGSKEEKNLRYKEILALIKANKIKI